jgi:hypothetical protein
MVRPERFELPTYCSGGNRSIHLSYGRASSVYMVALAGINSLATIGWQQCGRCDDGSVRRCRVRREGARALKDASPSTRWDSSAE